MPRLASPLGGLPGVPRRPRITVAEPDLPGLLSDIDARAASVDGDVILRQLFGTDAPRAPATLGIAEELYELGQTDTTTCK